MLEKFQTERGHGFESISIDTRASPLPPGVEGAVLSTGMTLTHDGECERFAMNALRGIDFVAYWLRISGQVTARWTRTHARARQRTLITIVSLGSVIVANEGDAAEVSRGQGVITPPGSAPMTLRTETVPINLILVAADASALHASRAGSEIPIQRIASPTLLSAGFGLWHGMANAPIPQSSEAAAALNTLAMAAVRTLLTPTPVAQLRSSFDVFERGQQYLRSHATNPGLSSAMIAEALGVSLRSLQVAFSKRGLTVNREIRCKRVEIALGLIETDSSIPRSIIARRAGFRSAKQLRDALRERELPSNVAVLRASGGKRGGYESADDEECGESRDRA